MVGDVKEEGVVWDGNFIFLPRWFVSVDESCFKKGNKSFR
jgi:hypothetical protein